MKKLIAILFFLIGMKAHATNFYVKIVGGDDNAAGTVQFPWASVAKVTAQGNGGAFLPGDSVLFYRGDIFFGTLIIYNDFIVVGSYGNPASPNPQISGMRTISSWTNIGGGLYTSILTNPPAKSDLSNNAGRLNMVTFQDTVQQMGRIPKDSRSEAAYYHISANPSRLPGDSLSLRINEQPYTGGINYPNNYFLGAEIVMRQYQWVSVRGTINYEVGDSFRFDRENVLDATPGTTGGALDGHGVFIQNSPKVCTQLGEWAYDTALNKITMFFGANNPGNYSVKYAGLDTLSYTSANGIDFINIDFSYSNVKGMVFNSDSMIKYTNCNISFCGAYALYITGNNKGKDSFSLGSVHDCLSGGLYLRGQASDQYDHNKFYNIGMWMGMCRSYDAQGTGIDGLGQWGKFENNNVYNIGFNGIHYMGRGIVIQKNWFHNIMARKSDGGAIYCYQNLDSALNANDPSFESPTSAHKKILFNIIDTVFSDDYGVGNVLGSPPNPYNRAGHGIYCDGQSINIDILNNTITNCAMSGIELGSNRDITVSGNTVYNNYTSQIYTLDDQIVQQRLIITNNILFARDTGQLLMQVERYNTPSYTTNLTMNNNYLFRPIWQPVLADRVKGYSLVGGAFSWGTYHDGGVIHVNRYETGTDSFYSVPNWRAYYAHDQNSVIPSRSQILSDYYFAYNKNEADSIITLPFNYKDVTGIKYPSGATRVPPYTSLMLIKDTTTVVVIPANNISIYFTSPMNGSVYSYGTSIPINSIATPKKLNTISKVELMLGGAVLQTLTAAPYNFSITGLGYGDYNLTARVTDNNNVRVTSLPLTVSVKTVNLPPGVQDGTAPEFQLIKVFGLNGNTNLVVHRMGFRPGLGVTIDLINNVGTVVSTLNTTTSILNNTINITGLATGTYTARVTVGAIVLTQAFTK